MKLSEYIHKEMKKKNINKTEVLKRLAEKSKVSKLTLHNVSKGGCMTMYDKAKAVSEATRGAVTVKELCE